MSWYPSLKIEDGRPGVVSQAGAGVLLRTAEKTGLTGELSDAFASWRRPGAVHDPGKIVLDLAVMHGIDAYAPLTIDLDATLTEAYSEKEHAAPTFKRGYVSTRSGRSSTTARSGTGEPAAVMLRPGNAGSNTAHDHKRVLADALAQLPQVTEWRAGRKVLVRADSGGGTHDFLDYCHRRRVQYSIRFTLTDDIVAAMQAGLTDAEWIPACDADGALRPGAWVAEVTGIVGLAGWPPGMRLIVRKERPHPGAQLRFTDHDGHRLTAFVTNTRGGRLPDLELRHRRRARCEDRIRAAKDTGGRNLPFRAGSPPTVFGWPWSPSPWT